MEKEKFVTLKQLCEHLDTTKPTVLKMIKKGLPNYKLNNDYRFKISEVEQYTKRTTK